MKIHNIKNYGAVGDGITMDTAAIQAAIDACKSGDKVVLPAGIYLSGPIFLKSDMTFYLEEGATLLGSGDMNDYPLYRYRFEGREMLCHGSLISTVDIRDLTPSDAAYESGYIADVTCENRDIADVPCGSDNTADRACRNGNIADDTCGAAQISSKMKRLRNITIAGRGTIDANGSTLRRQMLEAKKGIRGRALALRNVDGLVIRDVTVRHSPAWCVHTIYCRDVLLENVTICTKCAADGSRYEVHNGDGFDPDSCKDVVVRNCTIESQDDCIAIKSGRDEEGRRVGISTENVLVENCTFRYGFGVAVGSEMSGGVKHVLVRDCVFEDTHSLGSVKAPRGRGGVIEDIVYENIRHTNDKAEHKDCKWFRGAILVDQFYSHETYDLENLEPVGEGTALIKNIVFRNITTDTKAGNAIYLAGLPEQYLEDIKLINVTAHGKTGMIAANIKGLSMEKLQVTCDEGESMVAANVN